MEPRLQRFMYDDRLSPMARIMLAEIYKYHDTPVDCAVDDLFFSTLFKVSERQVRRWREELKTYGYLKESTNQFGKKVMDYCSEVEKRSPKKEDSTFQVIYKTKEGSILTNSIEAFAYFDELIFRQKNFSQNTASRIRQFCHIFANSIFDEKYYGLTFNKIVLTEDLFAFMIEHFKIEYIFETANRVMGNYAKIQNLNLYVLASLINCFKQDWQMFSHSKDWADYCMRRRQELEKEMDDLADRFRKSEEAYQKQLHASLDLNKFKKGGPS